MTDPAAFYRSPVSASICRGREAANLTVERLKRLLVLPLEWSEQHQLLSGRSNTDQMPLVLRFASQSSHIRVSGALAPAFVRERVLGSVSTGSGLGSGQGFWYLHTSTNKPERRPRSPVPARQRLLLHYAPLT